MEQLQKMTQAALDARRAYKREWSRNNRDKCKAQQARYWEKKARQMAEQTKAE